MDLSRPELALNGGAPVRTEPWKDNFTTGEEEKAAVSRVLDSGYLSLFEGSHTPDPPFQFWGGPWVQQLERDWCDYYDVSYSVSMNSATSGLYAALAALGVGYGDEVIVSPYTMSACAVGVLLYGAIPVFADIDPDAGSLDPESIASLVSRNTKAILVVHQFGIPAEMDAIMDIACQHDLRVIEDCAQAHGAKYKGRYVGTIGDVGVFSLNVNKSIQAGEGAVCTTNSEEWRYRLALVRNHGEAVVGPAGVGDITNMIGFNYRLSELHAAVAIEQLKKLDGLNQHRMALVRQLRDSCEQIDFLTPLPGKKSLDELAAEGTFPTYYVFPMRFDPEKAGIKRERFIEAVNAEGALFYQGYVRPLYLQPVYQQRKAFKHGYPFSAPPNAGLRMAFGKGTCPVAEDLHFNQMIINEHIRHPHTPDDIDQLVSIITKVID